MDDEVEGSNLGLAYSFEAIWRVFSGKTKLVSSRKAGNSSHLVRLEIANRLVSSSKAVNYPKRRGKKSFKKPTTL